MGLVNIDNLKPGMELDANVHDRNGRLLLGAGTILTDKHINIFRTWGVHEADITGMETGNDAFSQINCIDPDMWAAAEAQIKPLFRLADLDHPAIGELLRISILRKVQHGTR